MRYIMLCAYFHFIRVFMIKYLVFVNVILKNEHSFKISIKLNIK